jgi:hypothetical protein
MISKRFEAAALSDGLDAAKTAGFAIVADIV